jgi:hypothetical protein
MFWDTEKDFDTAWHYIMPYKLSELAFSTSLIKLTASFLSYRRLEALVAGEFCTPIAIAIAIAIAIGVSQGSTLALIL